MQYASETMRTILLAKVDHMRTDYRLQATNSLTLRKRMSFNLVEKELSGEKK